MRKQLRPKDLIAISRISDYRRPRRRELTVDISYNPDAAIAMALIGQADRTYAVLALKRITYKHAGEL